MDNKSGRENFLKDLLNSNCSSDELTQNMHKYALEWLEGRGYIIVFSIINAEKLGKELGDINFYSIRDEIAELLGEKIHQRAECEMVRVRVAWAKDMLRSGGCTISQVATAVGCANSNSFIRLFKRYEGITPGQYVDSIGKKT